MNPGKLRHRIRIQQQIFNDDPDTKESIANWQDVATVWAAVEPIKGREYFQALEVHAETTVKVRIRYRLGLSSDMRVLYSTRILYIQAVIDPEERHQELQLMCVENKPTGPGED